MKQLFVAVITLTAIVAGIVMATSLRSSAQEDGGENTTTTTIPEDVDGIPEDSDTRRDRFHFRFDGDLPPEFDELLTCLREQGIEVPENVDRSFLFDLRSEDVDGLIEAIEACGLPAFGFSDAFPFGGDLSESFPFDGQFDFDFEFGFGHGLDRDELASCLASLGSFDGVDQVREKLDECLPTLPDFGDLDPDDLGFLRGDRRGFGGLFGFGFDEAPQGEDTST